MQALLTNTLKNEELIDVGVIIRSYRGVLTYNCCCDIDTVYQAIKCRFLDFYYSVQFCLLCNFSVDYILTVPSIRSLLFEL
jgi:hypothetical protein